MEDVLIKAIQKRPCLFDKNSIMYRNKIAKEKAWKSVSHEVGASVKQCHIRWRSLRDRYVREMAKVRDSDSGGRPNWRYLEQLSFVEKHVKPKRRLSSLNNTAEDEAIEPTEFVFSELVQDTKNGSFQLSISKKSIQNDSLNDTCEEELLPEELLFQEVRCSETPPRPDTPPKKRQKMQENAHARFEKLCSAVTDLIESKKQSYNKSRNEDFLKVLDGYLLKLPEEEQDNLKVRILNMVHVNPLE